VTDSPEETPLWWTDEAREAAFQAVEPALRELNQRVNQPWLDQPERQVIAGAVLAALAPHVARQVAELTADRDDWMHLATEATVEAARYRRQAAGPEAENDNYRAGLIRVIGECDSAQARVDAVKMLCDSATDLGFQHVPVWRLLRALDGRP
jgi:hypothetical protein